MIERYRTWRAYRRERRLREQRAALVARLLVIGGAVDLPKKPGVNRFLKES